MLRLLDDHMGAVVRAVDGLRDLLDAAAKNDWSVVVSRADLVGKFETVADDAHREAVVELSRGAFFAGMREDFLNLLEQIDSIADAAQNAAHILAQSEPEAVFVKSVVIGDKPNLNDLLVKAIEAVALCRESVSALRSDTSLAVDKALSVEKAEEAADQMKTVLVRRIFTWRDRADPLSILQIRDFALKLDEVADAAEDVSDLVIAIVAKATG